MTTNTSSSAETKLFRSFRMRTGNLVLPRPVREHFLRYHNRDEYDDSNLAYETGESLENPRKSKATESDSVLTFLF